METTESAARSTCCRNTISATSPAPAYTRVGFSPERSPSTRLSAVSLVCPYAHRLLDDQRPVFRASHERSDPLPSAFGMRRPVRLVAPEPTDENTGTRIAFSNAVPIPKIGFWAPDAVLSSSTFADWRSMLTGRGPSRSVRQTHGLTALTRGSRIKRHSHVKHHALRGGHHLHVHRTNGEALVKNRAPHRIRVRRVQAQTYPPSCCLPCDGVDQHRAKIRDTETPSSYTTKPLVVGYSGVQAARPT